MVAQHDSTPKEAQNFFSKSGKSAADRTMVINADCLCLCTGHKGINISFKNPRQKDVILFYFLIYFVTVTLKFVK